MFYPNHDYIFNVFLHLKMWIFFVYKNLFANYYVISSISIQYK